MSKFYPIFLLLFFSACTASTYYSSPNQHFKQDILQTDTIIVRTLNSSVYVEQAPSEQAFIEWSYPKKFVKMYRFVMTGNRSKIILSDSVLTASAPQNAAILRLFILPETVIRVDNSFGNTFINHSGEAHTNSDSGSITFYQTRNQFGAQTKTGNIRIGLSDSFDQFGYIRSENGSVLLVNGAVHEKLQLIRDPMMPENPINAYFYETISHDKLPAVFISSDSSKTEISRAKPILWN